MSASEIIAFAVVLLFGVPAMLKNWTAVGLVASFLILQALYVATLRGWVTGPIPLQAFILCDFVVVTVIFLKGGEIGSDSIPDQARAIWRGLSRSDRIVLGLFLPCWAAYAVDLTDAHRYWILWTLGLLQFVVAGAEAFAIWRRGRARASSEAHPADWFLRQRYAGHGW